MQIAGYLFFLPKVSRIQMADTIIKVQNCGKMAVFYEAFLKDFWTPDSYKETEIAYLELL